MRAIAGCRPGSAETRRRPRSARCQPQALVLRKRWVTVGPFLGEFLDRAVHQRGSMDVVADQRLVGAPFLPISSAWISQPQRIVAAPPPFSCAGLVHYPAERALAGAIAQKAVIVREFDIEAVDVHRRQTGCAVPGRYPGDYVAISLQPFCPLPSGNRGTTGRRPIGFMRGGGASGELKKANSEWQVGPFPIRYSPLATLPPNPSFLA